MLRSLLEWGAERGASTAYLQVVAANTAALSLYEARGFERHHDYAYYVRPVTVSAASRATAAHGSCRR